MPLKVNSAQYTEKWSRNLRNARPDIERGIDRVTEAPGMKAAAAEDKLRQAFLESLDSGKWRKNVSAVSLEQWKTAAKEKGLARLDSGVTGALAKVQQIAEINLANIEAVKNTVDQMPDTTFQDRIAKMVAFSTGMHDKKVIR